MSYGEIFISQTQLNHKNKPGELVKYMASDSHPRTMEPESLDKDLNCLKAIGCWLSVFLPDSILPQLQPKEPHSRSNHWSDKGLMA